MVIDCRVIKEDDSIIFVIEVNELQTTHIDKGAIYIEVELDMEGKWLTLAAAVINEILTA